VRRHLPHLPPPTPRPRPSQAEFSEDLDSLGCRRPAVLTRVSEYVPEIVSYVQRIIGNGMAYECQGSVYFDIGSFWWVPAAARLRSRCYAAPLLAGCGPEAGGGYGVGGRGWVGACVRAISLTNGRRASRVGRGVRAATSSP
jgi:hypothetical protein